MIDRFYLINCIKNLHDYTESYNIIDEYYYTYSNEQLVVLISDCLIYLLSNYISHDDFFELLIRCPNLIKYAPKDLITQELLLISKLSF